MDLDDALPKPLDLIPEEACVIPFHTISSHGCLRVMMVAFRNVPSNDQKSRQANMTFDPVEFHFREGTYSCAGHWLTSRTAATRRSARSDCDGRHHLELLRRGLDASLRLC